MLSGLPASGKTTRAREIVKESGNSVRINRDDRPRLIRMWRELREEKHLTFPVIPVAGQCEEF